MAMKEKSQIPSTDSVEKATEEEQRKRRNRLNNDGVDCSCSAKKGDLHCGMEKFNRSFIPYNTKERGASKRKAQSSKNKRSKNSKMEEVTEYEEKIEGHVNITNDNNINENLEDRLSSSDVKELSRSNENQLLQDWFSPLHNVRGQKISAKLQYLKEKGITPVYGHWTSAEVNQLHQNMMDFLLSNDVKDFKRLIIPATPEDRRFRVDNQFGLKMCKGIRRTYGNVNQKVLYQHSNFLTKGKLSAAEKKELVQLRANGKNWKEIGLTMNRMHVGMSTIHASYSRNWNKGPWTREEDQLLRKAVSKFNVSSNDNDKGTWTQISEFVGTRPPVYCHNRWWRILSKREEVMEEEIIFSDDEIRKLVCEIHDSGVEDEHLVDWFDLSELFGRRVTPQWLRWKWGVLTKQVPRYHYLEFPEILEKLLALYKGKLQDNTTT